MSKKVKVLIVDDSASVRQTLSEILSDDPRIEVLGTAADPFAAARRISQEVPDVITLDVSMPKMDGITFLRKVMAQRPIPVVMCSALTEEGSSSMIEALDAGAVDIIAKPRVDTRQQLREAGIRICDTVVAAASARLRQPAAPGIARARDPEKKLTADVIMPPPIVTRTAARTTERVICIGASTGGTEALRHLLQSLPANTPGLVIVQHMPEHFTAAFANRLDSLCAMEVKEAADGDQVMRGRALIAPGNRHMLLHRNGNSYRVALKDGPLVTRHRPSVDVLFRSAAQYAGPNALGILMTGMGDDGAKGLLEMRQAGSATVAQDEASCVVFGMPKEAIALGAVEKVLPLDALAGEIVRSGG
ncbi:protein-glutamate methylesterase/protein-glutamine glutaminase [Telmatospirillum siberiense]|uniref:Protein-glutamate methylesterase/protein-glutamine glutaminase n=1 Tax=Telmatospirillum siberiense TaxID=382514 RepID=A0A2N3PQ94_9PROT|nr:chemotaxis response regulator protein-glutamate methylesterase [Telmatospirillum siberiense]PKU22575.1 chemotaxis response regulator protein-glutamate methylesterase [Telmatospirillum siberiense]